MNIGKIPSSMLQNIILDSINKNKRDDVLIRPQMGEDCSVIDIKDEYCIISTDPITGTDKNSGYLAVHINCNDIASSGGEPVGILLTILLPPNSDKSILEEIISGANRACNEIGIEILGGHTEVTDAVIKPLISATILGKSKNRKFVSSGNAEVGQYVVMTKWAGLEGTNIIANDYYDKLKNNLDESILKSSIEMSNFLSVIPESKISLKFATAMHDATEGGILGALWEVAECSKKGIIVYQDKIPIKYETSRICEFLNINPYRLISSGSMIITTFYADELLNELNNSGIKATIIGEITEHGKYLISNNCKNELLEPDTDELYKIRI